MLLNRKEILYFIRNALSEDVGGGDITTDLLIPKDKKALGIILAKEDGLICGLEICKLFFKTLDSNIMFKAKFLDGDFVRKGRVIARILGNARPILMAERSGLNMLSHLCGIATLTNRFVKAVRPYGVKIMDTRKTIPGLRLLEKYAVSCAGGYNHRMGLYDQMLIKDNHLKVVNSQWSVVNRAIKKAKRKKITTEIEVKNLKELKQALMLKPDIVMLDNMNTVMIKKAVKMKDLFSKRTKLEASGGVNLKNVRLIAKTGIDFISIGSLTDSAQAIDMSLEVV